MPDEDYDGDDNYYFADEVGWINKTTGKVVEAHEGYTTKRQRESEAEWIREELAERRRNKYS
jgi:hypothetical protein